MDTVGSFLASPTLELLEKLTKEQIHQVAEHFEIDLGAAKGFKKPQLRSFLKDKLVQLNVFTISLSDADMSDVTSRGIDSLTGASKLDDDSSGPIVSQESQLKFQSMRTELEMQFEVEKLRLAHELEERKLALQEKRLAHEQEEKRLAHELEVKKLSLEAERLKLRSEGRLSGGSFNLSQGGDGFSGHNLVNMLKLVPKFNEQDPDVFFSLFEDMAEDNEWGDLDCSILLQSVLVGKAQEAYVSLTSAERKVYKSVKEAVLKAYELVPEHYRQQFRNCRKAEKQTNTDLVRQLNTQFYRWLSAEGVKEFESLCDLMVLEQFKTIIPDRVATYVNEQKVKTAAKAAVLADEYVLTHKTVRDYNWKGSYSFKESHHDWFSGKTGVEPTLKSKADSVCNYCRQKGHWKNECPLNTKIKSARSKRDNQKPVALASVSQLHSVESTHPAKVESVRPTVLAAPVDYKFFSELTDTNPQICEKDVRQDYAPFITNGFVSLSGSSNKVAVKILRDTGASESFILESVLPFSLLSDTGCSVLIRGIGLETFSVPLHKIYLQSELVQGEVTIAVRPSLSVEGVSLILGNNLAGGRVWRDVAPPPVVRACPSVSVSDVCARDFPEAFPACAVTRAITRSLADKEDESGKPGSILEKTACLPTLPVPLSLSELIAAQQEDTTLAALFDQVQAAEQDTKVSSGYFLQKDLLCSEFRGPFRQTEEPTSPHVCLLRF
ncbi:uncharacterized protein LOC122833417 isoform X2 [Gambusia affinis]|uniref:uncharacterized protein LOC122833417 isoform X2 n=1 Tax=Gambusia affinis TaxID=33528 RepID=UPI001CDD39B0|nr:uncharacterized protein LOC122833417 isoform X2 [Gambusia affinis]